ncbi:MAG: Hpt domain-containing protein [Planctomycetota bacterium]
MTDKTKQQESDQLFREVVSQMSADLAAFAGSLRAGSARADDHEKVYEIAHSLHGSGKLYGYPCVSELGASLENVVEALQERRLAGAPALASLIESCSAALLDLANLAVPDDAARAKIRDRAWECECVLHATPAPARNLPAENPAGRQAP